MSKIFQPISIKIKLAVVSLLFCSFTFGQIEKTEKPGVSKNTVYVELFANAGYLYNLSYDRLVYTHEKHNLSTGLGVQFFPSSDLSSDHILSVSPQVNYLYGIKHHIETGLGLTYDFYSGDLVFPVRIGYRFQKPEGGVFYKIGLTPLITKSYPILGEGFSIIPWGGIAMGWTF